MHSIFQKKTLCRCVPSMNAFTIAYTRIQYMYINTTHVHTSLAAFSWSVFVFFFSPSICFLSWVTFPLSVSRSLVTIVNWCAIYNIIIHVHQYTIHLYTYMYISQYVYIIGFSSKNHLMPQSQVNGYWDSNVIVCVFLLMWMDLYSFIFYFSLSLFSTASLAISWSVMSVIWDSISVIVDFNCSTSSRDIPGVGDGDCCIITTILCTLHNGLMWNTEAIDSVVYYVKRVLFSAVIILCISHAYICSSTYKCYTYKPLDSLEFLVEFLTLRSSELVLPLTLLVL